MRKLRINYSIYYLLFLILLEFIQLFKFIAYFYSTNIDFILLFLIISQYRRSFRNWFIEFEIIIFDDIYILLHIPYFITYSKNLYQYLLLSLSLFSILDVIIYIQNIENRVHAILIHCSLPFDEYQFYIISFKQKMRYIKNWFTEFENIISTISINITSHFLWKNFMVCHHLYSRFHVLPRWRHELRLQ